MSTESKRVRRGNKIICGGASLAKPQPKGAWPVPTFASAESSHLSLQTVIIAGQGAAGIQVASDGPLPGGAGANWVLMHQASQDSTFPSPERLPLTLAGGMFSLTLAAALADATHIFWLVVTEAGRVTTYPKAQLTTPVDPTQTDLSGKQPASSILTALSTAPVPSPAGTYGSTTKIPQVTVDIYGRVTAVVEVTAAGAGGGSSSVPVLWPKTSAVPGMTSNTAPSGVVSASSAYSTAPAWQAFDANNSGWVSNAGGVPAWVQYQFATAKTILSYSIQPWSNDSYQVRWLTGWHLDGSNDGSTWTTLDTRTHKLNRWAPFVPEYFTIGTPGSYTHYRLVITGNGGNSYVGLQHLELYES